MKHFVYLLITHHKKNLITYVGYTTNIKKRLKLHNSSKGAKFTKGKYWKIIYKKKYNTKKEAMINEYRLKKNKIKRNIIKNNYKFKNSIKL